MEAAVVFVSLVLLWYSGPIKKQEMSIDKNL